MLDDRAWRRFYQNKFWLPYGNDFWFNDSTKHGALHCFSESHKDIPISKEGVFYLYDAVRRQKIRAAFVVLEAWPWHGSIEVLPVDKVSCVWEKGVERKRSVGSNRG